MKYIYLDQNMWISLARALRTDDSRDREVKDVFYLAAAASDSGVAVFPLSLSHMMEVWNRGNSVSRMAVATVMFRLARGQRSHQPDTIRYFSDVARDEMVLKLNRELRGVDAGPNVSPFGKGLSNITGDPNSDYPWPLNLIMWSRPEDGWLEGVESNDQPYNGIRNKHEEIDKGLVKVFRDQQLNREQRIQYLAADTFRRFEEEFEAALRIASVDAASFNRKYGTDTAVFLESVPTCDVYFSLRCERFNNLNLPSRQTDMEDLAWISPAVVHCDVVVMEKHWAHLLNRAGLSAKYRASVITDIRQLGEYLD